MTEAGEEIKAIIARIFKIEKIQRTNLPRFRDLLKRVTAMETALKVQGSQIASLEALAKADAELRRANAEKLDTLLAFTTHAKSIGGFMRKHGPRFIAFAIGVAIAKGWITAENGGNFLHLFGL